jgi:hypothetical protein
MTIRTETCRGALAMGALRPGEEYRSRMVFTFGTA